MTVSWTGLMAFQFCIMFIGVLVSAWDHNRAGMVAYSVMVALIFVLSIWPGFGK